MKYIATVASPAPVFPVYDEESVSSARWPRLLSQVSLSLSFSLTWEANAWSASRYRIRERFRGYSFLSPIWVWYRPKVSNLANVANHLSSPLVLYVLMVLYGGGTLHARPNRFRSFGISR